MRSDSSVGPLNKRINAADRETPIIKAHVTVAVNGGFIHFEPVVSSYCKGDARIS